MSYTYLKFLTLDICLNKLLTYEYPAYKSVELYMPEYKYLQYNTIQNTTFLK